MVRNDGSAPACDAFLPAPTRERPGSLKRPGSMRAAFFSLSHTPSLPLSLSLSRFIKFTPSPFVSHLPCLFLSASPPLCPSAYHCFCTTLTLSVFLSPCPLSFILFSSLSSPSSSSLSSSFLLSLSLSLPLVIPSLRRALQS